MAWHIHTLYIVVQLSSSIFQIFHLPKVKLSLYLTLTPYSPSQPPPPQNIQYVATPNVYWQWHPTPVLLPGKSHGQRSLVGCNPWVAKSRTWLSDFTFTFHFHTLKKEMATHSSVLAWRIPGTGEPGGLPSVGWHRVGHDWSDLAAAAAAAVSVRSCPTLCHSMDGSLPGSSVHGILQEK